MQCFNHTSIIVVVDDNKFSSSLVKDIIEESGFKKVISFNSPFEALEYIKYNRQVKIVISDYVMFGMDGLKLLDKVKTIDKKCYGILISCDFVPANNKYIVLDKFNKLQCNLISAINIILTH